MRLYMAPVLLVLMLAVMRGQRVAERCRAGDETTQARVLSVGVVLLLMGPWAIVGVVVWLVVR